MVILEIISICLLAILIVIMLVLFTGKRTTKAMTIKDCCELRDYIQMCFNEQNKLNKTVNDLMVQTMSQNNNTVINAVGQNATLHAQQLSDIMSRLNKVLESSSESMKNATMVLQTGLERLQNDNEKKLEQMRQTVDEKLNVSLERRLTESFKVINDRLQSVYEGLGEMKNLANGVGDLKKVLTNVKTRGIWGEVQLGNLLEQMMTPEQYDSQVAIKAGSAERVDFVIKLPGKSGDEVLLPIDAKFPIEDYQRLVDASERGDQAEIDACLKALERRVKDEAKSIKEKYINVPKTTDFAVMYLSIEGLYAEVLRRPGLAEALQRDYKINVCGPTTLASLLNSLQMGFRTLTIEKRTSEVWNLLGAVKQEFGKFVELLAKTQKKLVEASNTIEFATKKSRTIERKLKNIAIENTQQEYLDLNDESETNETNEQDLLGDSDE
ncbi:MAG: DNA recombination protein RmuC [Eubacteriales bacterium]|nr:DNA recombination protein RmuC [Clostridia bacterium]MDY2696462.1 DNA recombination protein RmuC [Eubacteriales bacterium]